MYALDTAACARHAYTACALITWALSRGRVVTTDVTAMESDSDRVHAVSIITREYPGVQTWHYMPDVTLSKDN